MRLATAAHLACLKNSLPSRRGEALEVLVGDRLMAGRGGEENLRLSAPVAATAAAAAGASVGDCGLCLPLV